MGKAQDLRGFDFNLHISRWGVLAAKLLSPHNSQTEKPK